MCVLMCVITWWQGTGSDSMPDHLGDQAAVGVLGVLALRTGRWKSPAGPSESAAQHASMRHVVSA